MAARPTVVGLVSLLTMLQVCIVIIWLRTQNGQSISCIQSTEFILSKSSDSNAVGNQIATSLSQNWTSTDAETSELASSNASDVNATLQQSRVTKVSDVFVSIKTTSSFHAERLPPLLSTWLTMVHGKQVHIVTDSKFDSIARNAEDLGMTVIEADCSAGHEDEALCCKSGVEYEQYYAAVERGEDYRWFCHFDDDVYVNVQNLAKHLRLYQSTDNVYVGHYSSRWPAKKVTDKYRENFEFDAELKGTHFYYALGPVYCISKKLMEKLPQFFRGDATFKSTCKKTGFPDDATVGVIIEHYLGYKFFQAGWMMNELDVPLSKSIPASKCKRLITIGYVRDRYYHAHKKHHLKYTLDIPMLSERDDPTGFRSLHCFLFPRTDWCNQNMDL